GSCLCRRPCGSRFPTLPDDRCCPHWTRELRSSGCLCQPRIGQTRGIADDAGVDPGSPFVRDLSHALNVLRTPSFIFRQHRSLFRVALDKPYGRLKIRPIRERALPNAPCAKYEPNPEFTYRETLSRKDGYGEILQAYACAGGSPRRRR